MVIHQMLIFKSHFIGHPDIECCHGDKPVKR